MRFLATIREFTSLLFNRTDGTDVELKPTSTPADGAGEKVVNIPDDNDNTDTIVLENQTQTISKKTIVHSDTADTDNKISGLTDSTISDEAGINAEKIHNGNITNTEFGHLDGVTANIQTQLNQKATDADLTAHITNATDAHDASAVSYDNTTSGLPATDIQTAIDEVEARVDANDAKVSADGSVTTHSDVTDAGSGAIITATERTQITTNQTDLSTHISDTQAHGASGAVVGTLNAQTLKDKTLDALQYTSASVAILTNLPIVDDVVMKLVGSPTNIETLTFPSSPLDDTIKVLTNETGNTINLVENVGAKGFQTGTGANLPLLDNGSAIVIYDASEDRWRVIGGAGGSGGGLSLSTIAAGGAVSVNTHYLTTSGPYTITLPEGEPGAVIRFSDTDSTWHTGNITLTPDGAETIDGESELILDVQDSWVQLMWNGSEWVTDDSLDPNTADFTGDLDVSGDISVTGTVKANSGVLTKDSATEDLTIDAGCTLSHPFLTIESGVTYTNNGQMVVAGTLITNGTLIDNGTTIVL